MQKSVDERAAGDASPGMNYHPGGLVDHHDVVVLIEHNQRDGLGFRLDGGARGGLHANGVALAKAQ